MRNTEEYILKKTLNRCSRELYGFQVNLHYVVNKLLAQMKGFSVICMIKVLFMNLFVL